MNLIQLITEVENPLTQMKRSDPMKSTQTPTDETPTALKRWLSPDDLFKEFGFSKSNQDKLRMNRKIPFSKVGRYVRYDRLEIDKWLVNNKVDMTA